MINKIKQISNLKSYIEYLGVEYDRNNKFCCPLCGSGSGKNKTSAFTIKDEYFKCFSCNSYGDIIDFEMKYNEIGKSKAIKNLANYYGIKKEKPNLIFLQIGWKLGLDKNKNLINIPKYKSTLSLRRLNNRNKLFEIIFNNGALTYALKYRYLGGKILKKYDNVKRDIKIDFSNKNWLYVASYISIGDKRKSQDVINYVFCKFFRR